MRKLVSIATGLGLVVLLSGCAHHRLGKGGPDEFSVARLAACMGRAVGAVRLSLGLANHRADVDRAIAVVASFAEGAGTAGAATR